MLDGLEILCAGCFRKWTDVDEDLLAQKWLHCFRFLVVFIGSKTVFFRSFELTYFPIFLSIIMMEIILFHGVYPEYGNMYSFGQNFLVDEYFLHYSDFHEIIQRFIIFMNVKYTQFKTIYPTFDSNHCIWNNLTNHKQKEHIYQKTRKKTT